jgi:transcriptional regulator with XRE-family HTH domain
LQAYNAGYGSNYGRKEKSLKTEIIIKNIEEVAKRKGLSIAALERKAGLARGHFYKLKSTAMQLETLARIADALDVSVSYLLRERKE